MLLSGISEGDRRERPFNLIRRACRSQSHGGGNFSTEGHVNHAAEMAAASIVKKIAKLAPGDKQASLFLDAKVERSDIAGMEENLHPVARSFSNQSFQATAGRSQNRLEPKTSSENFRHNPEMSDLSTLASKSKDACSSSSTKRVEENEACNNEK